MATITATAMTGTGKRTVTEVTLTGTDDTFAFTYEPGKEKILIMRNATAGALTPIIDGAGASTVQVSGVGAVDISTGYAVGSIAASAVVGIPLNTIREYLSGTIAITGGTGLVCSLLVY